MRIPKIYKRDNSNNQNIKEIELEVEKLPIVDYDPDIDFDDEKSVNRYVRTIKAAIRGSDEYKKLMRFLKEKCDVNKCFFMPHVRKMRDSNITIEIHHTGFVMEDIVLIVLRKKYAEGEKYDVQSVAEEVMRLHYEQKIFLTALSATAHSLIHEDDSGLFIPLQYCDFGDGNQFFEEYKKYIPKDTAQKYSQYQILSGAIANIDEIIPDYLDRHYIYYKCEGVEIPDMNKILEIVDLD